MKGKRIVRAALLILCALLLIPSIPGERATVMAAALTDSKVKEYETRLEQLDAKMKELQKSIKAAASDEEKLRAEKEVIDKEIALLMERIEITNDLIAARNDSIAQKEADITAKQGEYDVRYEQFKERIRITYEEGKASYLDMLFGAESLSDFLARVDRVGAMLEWDTEMMSTLSSQRVNLEDEKAALEAEKAEAIADLNQLREDERIMEQKSEAALAKANQLKANQQYWEKQKEKMAAEEEKLDKELEAYLQELQKKQNNKYVGGTYMWPVDAKYNRISSGVVNRTNPITGKREYHNGIDIPADFGANIYAANAGTVIKVVWDHWSYGNYCMIDHGGGYTTLYAHSSRLLVTVGQKVSKGQVIAKVGSTGQSTGNHLHFSYYVNGVITDPTKTIFVSTK